MHARILTSVLALLAAVCPQAARAQELRSQLMSPIVLEPVSFDAEPKDSIGFFTNVANTLFKPKGNGPFPAVVLMHTCGGVGNPHIKQHAQELLNENFAVLVVDSFTSRGMENCASRILSGSAGIADAYTGLKFLASKPFVDASRIYQVGYSWGAIVSIWLSSPQSAALVSSGLRFKATVSNYSGCSFDGKYKFLLNDIDKPLLMLMGGRDNELPSDTCFPLLEELKAAGRPIEWHIFPEATHSWDKPTLPERGYVFNEQVTRDATAKMLQFIGRTP